MKIFILRFLTIVQIIFFAGIFILERLSHKYMTIMRIALYKKRLWEAELPMDSLLLAGKVFFIALALISFAVLLLKAVKKNRVFARFAPSQLILLAVLAGGSAIFISTASTDTIRTYYYAVFLLSVIIMVQLVKMSIKISQGKSP